MTQTEKLPLLYSFRRCPYAMRARMVLINHKIPFELREVDLKNKPADMLAYSPKGTVPVLVLPNGNVIDESLDIVDYILDYTNDEATEALIEKLDQEFIPALHHYKYQDRYENLNVEDEVKKMNHFMSELNDILQVKKHLGDRPLGKADIAILPFIRQLYRADEAFFNALPYDALKEWFFDFFNSELHRAVMNC